MSYFPETVSVEILTTPGGVPTWTDISGDIVTPIKVNRGFTDTDQLSRLAPGGDLRFDLYNPTGAYDPSDSFYKSQKIRVRVKWGSFHKVKFFGYIDHIGLDVGTWGPRQVHVTCVTWLALAARTPIRALAGLTNTTIDVAVRALLTQMQLQPEQLDIEVGDITLPSVFDQVTPNSTVYSELQNLVMGEWGYIYERDGGMTLKVENSTSRTGEGSDYKTTAYYINDGVEEDFLLEDGTNFLLEDGTNFLLGGEPTTRNLDPDLGETYKNLAINHGDILTNKVLASSVPVVVGTSVVVLFPFDIATGSKAFLVPKNNSANPYVFQGQYKDPTAGGAQISGSSVVTPVVTTDWKFNSLPTGLGTDLSANITITFTAGQSGFKASIINAGDPGYFTKFNVRGIPIYRYSPVETTMIDQRSVWDNGEYSMQFTRQYGQNSDDIRPFIFRLIMRDRKPRTVFGNPKFDGFDTVEHLAAFLGFDIGDQIRLSSTRPPSDAIYYIQGEKFSILPGSEQVTFEYVTAETLAGEVAGISEVAIEQTGGTKQNIDFGYLAYVAGNHPYRSITARIYLSDVGVNDRVIFSINSRVAFYISGVTGGLLLRYLVERTGSTDTWKGNTSPAEGAWVNVAVTFDSTSTSNNPLFYINGAAIGTTKLSGASSGAPKDETGFQVTVGNYSRYDTLNTYPFTGKYEDVTVYSRILTPTEISTIHNGGTRLPFASYPKNGLRFFFGGVDNDTYADKLNNPLDELNTVYELWNGFPGQPIANPTLKAVG